MPPDLVSQNRPKTPPYQPEQTAEDDPLDSAWNPSSRMPCQCEASHLCMCDANILRQPRPNLNQVYLFCHLRLCYSKFMAAGEWLLDQRLQGKRLDVRIRGTTVQIWHNGAYEDACGILVLTKVPKSVDDSVVVKIGYNRSKIYFPLRYIFPQITTERPMFVSRNDASPVVKTIGERVLIIGNDAEGKSDYIGHHAVVIHCIWPLLGDQGCLQIVTTGPFWGTIRYFSDTSLCRSDAGELDWFDTIIS